jgi:heme-degrading monooxygenase HmoA
MEIVLFHIRTKEGIDTEEYNRAFEQMLAIVSQSPGFLGIEGFTGEDGSELAIARFDSPESVLAWKNQPDHVIVQQRGRDEFFAKYDITVATVSRQYGWP